MIWSEISIDYEKDDVPITYLKPKYNDVDLFIYIGGLMGCWLGMSLWTSIGILGRGISALGSTTHQYKRAKRAQRKRKNMPLVRCLQNKPKYWKPYSKVWEEEAEVEIEQMFPPHKYNVPRHQLAHPRRRCYA
ncbi:hypothetical protein JTE90_014852 [Oedothorax gibbosus]|uniref:Uncharacterized protein n=1 Tax=Oedothorax gibbosus TaxID=931172 RepID=A0AAV6U060_9ARAC|nr:hypothetical protein JTE90_014852 [Oedothorax gibbosus]